MNDAIATEDMGYHKHMMAQSAEVPQLQQQARQIQQRLQDIQGAQASWAGYLQQKYGLGEGDLIEADGSITRRQPATNGTVEAVPA